MKKLASAAAVAAAVLMLSGCGGSRHYPANVQANFLNSCEANGGGVHECGCVLSNIEKSVSLDKFAAADDAIRNGSASEPDWAYAAAAKC